MFKNGLSIKKRHLINVLAISHVYKAFFLIVGCTHAEGRLWWLHYISLFFQHLVFMSFQTNNTFIFKIQIKIFFMKPERFLSFYWKSVQPELWKFKRFIELFKYDKLNCTCCTRTKLKSSCGSSKICLPDMWEPIRFIKLSLFYVCLKCL